MKHLLLDLFSGAGGCAKGYQRAGFRVVGVDNRSQPRYCGGEFVQADALDVLDDLLAGGAVAGYRLEDFAAIHASPPCQDYLNLTAVNRALGREAKHGRLIAATRDLLIQTEVPYVIENVPDARSELLAPVRLCGSSFGLAVERHRLFESGVPIMALPCAHHLQREPKYWTGWRPGGEKRLSKVVQVYGNAADKHEWPAAMGIDWMTYDELAEAVPPSYTEHVGYFLMLEVGARASRHPERTA